MAASAPVRSAGRSGNVLGTINLTVDDGGIAHIGHDGLADLGETGDAYLIKIAASLKEQTVAAGCFVDVELLILDSRLGLGCFSNHFESFFDGQTI